MIEKVNPAHPDKIADRIAGALVDLAYRDAHDPRIAVEVLIGHGKCHIIAETSVKLDQSDVGQCVGRIAGDVILDYVEIPQDPILAQNQSKGMRCGDNGIFRGVPLTEEQKEISRLARSIYKKHPYDGKYILDRKNLIICQSHTDARQLWEELYAESQSWEKCSGTINPLGYWTGGTDVDTGATNRKLGSDMADSVTGGGLHGKDLSKADVSVNIYAFQKAQRTGKTVEISCAIGDQQVDGCRYEQIVEDARIYIKRLGGFEKFAEWGLY